MRRACAAAIVAAVTLVAAACSNGGEAEPEPEPEQTTTTTIASAPIREDDGQLTIGVLVPVNDPIVGEPLRSGVAEAVTVVNQSGGILDRPVRTVVVDEGVTAGSAATALEVLGEAGVDAIVGPTSSLVTLNVLSDLVAGDVLTCSPTATAMSLDGFPDDGLFFRTIPSDSLQADAIAERVDETGALSAAVVHVDDAYGRAFADATLQALGARQVEVVATASFTDRDDDLSEQTATIAEADTDVVIVLGSGEAPARFLAALDQEDTTGIVGVVVNGDVRSPESEPLIAALSAGLRSKLITIGAQAEADPDAAPWVPEGPYAANAYDCVNLIALSALLAESTDAHTLATLIPEVTAGGSVCTTFDACREIVENGLNLDYVGPTGVLEVGRQGDPTTARFSTFEFDAAGRAEWRDSFVHSA